MSDEKEIERREAMAGRIATIESNVLHLTGMVTEMHKVLTTNGITTRLALHGKSIKVQWWAISVVLVGIIGLAIKTAFK